MQHVIFEFNSEKEMRDIVEKLWEGLGVSGELHTRSLSGGRWRVEIIPEKELKEATIEKFAEYRVEVGG